jgi:uncharacterized membrane protein
MDCVYRRRSGQFSLIVIPQEASMAKSLSFGVMHLGIAFGVTYALTGSVAVAGAVTLIEPTLNTIAHYFFDRAWARPDFTAWRARVAMAWRPAPSGVPAR